MISGYVFQFWFSLQEIFDEYLERLGAKEWDNINFYEEFHSHYPNAPIYPSGVNNLKPYLNDLLNLVYARFKDHYIVSSDDDVLTNELKEKAILKIINIIVNTYPKYSELMSYYESLEGKLMKQIGSTTKAIGRFNDTPQNGGDFDTDLHTSNITKSETEIGVDGDTPIERLNEIKSKLSSILYDWSNEFDKIFIEEGNI